MDLFDRPSPTPSHDASLPLAERMRPRTFDELVGQPSLTDDDGALQTLIEGAHPPSMILWGPPGSGKTTFARLVATVASHAFVEFSAILGGVKEIREIIKSAEQRLMNVGRRTILFVDEIHHFNRSQQDAFLPHVERGTIVLIGATTENPSFRINAPLLSRARVVALRLLEEEDVVAILGRAVDDEERGVGGTIVEVTDEVLRVLARSAEGDARRALNWLETAANIMATRGLTVLDEALVEKVVGVIPPRYDKGAEEHYSVISAFIKSMRGSDPHAALYWLARMLEAGEDPLFILRRMCIFASEDVGNADPNALAVAVHATESFRFVGLPEGFLPMAQAAVYLASAPKSNASYAGYLAAKEAVKKRGSLPVPLHLRNATTDLMAELGYGQGYAYPHDDHEGALTATYLPDALRGRVFYEPKDAGIEAKIRARLERLGRLPTSLREADDD